MVELSYRILLVEDELSHVTLIKRAFRQERPGDILVICAAVSEALTQVKQGIFDAVVSDYSLPDGTALSLLEEVQRHGLDLPVIVVTGYGDTTTAVQAMKLGATDFIVKSENYARALPLVVQNAIGKKRLQRQLKISEDRYHRLYEQAHQFFTLSFDVLCMVGFDGRLKYLNPAWERTLGYSSEELLACPFIEFVHAEDREFTLAQMEKLVTGMGPISFEHRYRCKDGSYKWLWWNATGFAEQEMMYCVAHDFTERKLAEQEIYQLNDELEQRVAKRTRQLEVANKELERQFRERKELEAQFIQAQKMESIGRLAGGVAHDFNNLLTAIMNYAEVAIRSIPEDNQTRNCLHGIQKATKRGANLTRQLLAFARRQVIEPRVINLNDLILDIEKLLRRLIGEDINLVTLTEPELWAVKVDPGQIEQVLINLAINARDAMPDGGNLTIQTKNVMLTEEDIRYMSEITPGPFLMLLVEDAGVGMTEEVKEHLFEPFFTTKAEGKGTGLGLATSYGIVKQSGGHIFVESDLGHGTTFKIYLPQATNGQMDVACAEESSQLLPGTETILLVEDEMWVREVTAFVLREQGYRVLEVADGPEALSLIQEPSSGKIHLLLTDVIMPQMRGNELAHHVKTICPDAKIMFMSGYTDDAIAIHGVLEPGIAFLPKPFSSAVLTRKVREVLDSQLTE